VVAQGRHKACPYKTDKAMKQVVLDLRRGEVRVEELPAPCCLPQGVLVRSVASLISSGTERAALRLGRRTLLGKALERPDLALRLLRQLKTTNVADIVATARARLEAVQPLGYSAAGVVLEVGRGADEFVVGDRVACAGTGYASHAEVNWVPKNLCVRIPPGMDFQDAASVALGAIALEGVRVAGVAVGERVAVVGLGLVGLLTAQVLKAAGCTVWGIDPDPGRVSLARELGLDVAFENSHLRGWGPNEGRERAEGMDAVILTAATRSSEPVELAGLLARERGLVVVVGDFRVDVPRELYYKKELQLRYSRSYGPGRYDSAYEERGADYPYGFVRWTENRNMRAYLDLVAAQKVRVQPLITHRFAVDDAREGYDLVGGRRPEKYVGIVLTYPQAAPAVMRLQSQGDPANCPEPPDVGAFDRITALAPLGERVASVASRVRERGGNHAVRNVAGHDSSTVRIGWIGAGEFSRGKLLPAVRKLPKVALVGLANSSGISAQSAARDFGFGYCSTDAREVLHDRRIDAVFIGTRHHLHAPLVTEALEAGKHVFVEKPLCVNEAELERISVAHSKAGYILAVGYNRRFSPFARECLRFFGGRAEPLSIIYRVNAAGVPRTHWLFDPSEGHGPIIGEVCHFVDAVQYLTSSVAVWVEASALGSGARAGEGNLHVKIGLADGSLAEIFYLSSGDAQVAKERVEVFGAGRTAICEDYRVWRFYQGRYRKRSCFRQDKGHREEMRAFVEAVAKGGPAPISFESLRATSLATFGICESLSSGLRVSIGSEASCSAGAPAEASLRAAVAQRATP
jgi:predicted dehydrogenase/threonine dehydrogenase-like Zn-dependent dehydrogenase